MEMVSILSPKQKAYRKFFRKKLKDNDVDSPAKLKEEEKSEFFNDIKKTWKKEVKTIEGFILESTIDSLYPKDLTQLTPKQEKIIIKNLAKLTLTKLRKKQELTEKQQKVAFKKKDTKALNNLNVKLNHLTEAIILKEFD
jgi:hypothetical protein